MVCHVCKRFKIIYCQILCALHQDYSVLYYVLLLQYIRSKELWIGKMEILDVDDSLVLTFDAIQVELSDVFCMHEP